MLSFGLWRVNKLSIKTLKLKRNEKLQAYILKTLEGRLLHKDYWVKHIWPVSIIHVWKYGNPNYLQRKLISIISCKTAVVFANLQHLSNDRFNLISSTGNKG